MQTPNVLCEMTEIGGRHLNLPVGAEEIHEFTPITYSPSVSVKVNFESNV